MNEYLVKVEYTGHKVYKVYAESIEEAAKYSDEWLERNTNPVDDSVSGQVVSLVKAKVLDKVLGEWYDA
jgi:hypothetical protein